MLEIKNRIIKKHPEKIHRIWCAVKKTIIIIFFSLNVGIMIVGALPDRSAIGAQFINLVSRYQAWTMLYQPWSMFAPNPMNTNAYVNAEIQFNDGTIEEWPLLRQRLLKNPRRVLVGDRYRIFSQKTLVPNRNELVWFDISKYIAHQVAQRESEGKKRSIKQILFKRYSNVIKPPPEAPLIPHGTLSTSYNVEPVFYYQPTTEKVSYEAKNTPQINR